MALIVLLGVAVFGALAFWQLRQAQSLRLRLLAGFSQAVEDEVQAVARRISTSVGVQELTADRLLLDPYVTYVASSPASTCGAGGEALGLQLFMKQDSTYFRYCVHKGRDPLGYPSVGPETMGTEVGVVEPEPTREEQPDYFLEGTVRLDLDSVVRSLVLLLPPLALIAWPFLKLALIGPRQRFTRWDVLLLFGGTVLGIFLAVLVVFGFLFTLRDEAQTDEQLERLSQTVNDALERSVQAVHDDLARVLGPSDPERIERYLSRFQEAMWGLGSVDPREELRHVVREIMYEEEIRPRSSLIDSLSWVDRYGQVALTLPLTEPAIRYGFPYAGIGRDTAAEDYFRCASRGDETGTSGICTGIDRSPVHHAPVLVVADRLPLHGSSREWDGGVLAARFRPLTLELPLLAPGFELAVVEPSGRVLFHSDARRALSENLFLAVDDDPLLRDLVRNQRRGHLTTTYWGREIRAHVAPLAEMDSSLLVYRRLDGGRERLFELAHDYLNLSLLYLVFYGLLLTLLWVPARERLTRLLWPSAAYQPIYWKVSVLTPIAAGLLGCALFAGSAEFTFALTFFLPVLLAPGAVLVGLLLLWWHDLPPRLDSLRRRLLSALPFRFRTTGRFRTMRRRRILALVTGSGAALAIASLVLGANPLVVLAFGLAAAWSVALWWWRSELRRKQSRTPYLVAAGGAITVLALLPATGFMSLAHDRQSQLMVQETQLTLARQWIERRDLVRTRVRSYVIPLDEPGHLQGEVSQAYLAAFDTRHVTQNAWRTPSAAPGAGPEGGDTRELRSAGRARGLLESVMAARLGTLQSLSTISGKPGLGISAGEGFDWRRIPAQDELALSYSAGRGVS